MKSTLLAIGDLAMDGVKKAPSINKFLRYRKRLINRRIKFEFITYDDVLLKRLPDISTKALKIMLFFPFTHWNSNIERYDLDDRIYGDKNFGRDYKRFFLKIDKITKDKYKSKLITYINSPKASILDRDKKKSALILKRNGILAPKTYSIINLQQFNKLLDKVSAFYIKPPFGAMGKGISFVTKNECWTNFIFRKGKIISRPYDYDWEFIRISRKKRGNFLKILIKKKFIFEEAIKLPVVKRRKFDFRVYAIYGKIPYLYAKSAPVKSFITNWSQGGRIEKKRFLKNAVPPCIMEEIKSLARKGSDVMDLNYAGVDIIWDSEYNKVYFLEAHSFPGYEKGFNLMKFLMDRI